MRRIVRACINATGFFQVRAQIARGGFLLCNGFLAAGPFGIIGHHFKGMEVDVPVRTIERAEAATDTPVFDDDFERIAATDGPNGAAHHAEGVAALAARSSDKVLLKAE